MISNRPECIDLEKISLQISLFGNRTRGLQMRIPNYVKKIPVNLSILNSTCIITTVYFPTDVRDLDLTLAPEVVGHVGRGYRSVTSQSRACRHSLAVPQDISGKQRCETELQ